jgi:hypothetical protein
MLAIRLEAFSSNTPRRCNEEEIELMLPIILGAAALAGGAASAYSNWKKNKGAQSAYGGVGDIAQQGADAENAIANRYGWQERLNAASQLRQDANKYETDQAIQGALAAYGDNPLSGGARAGVLDRLQQNARANYQTSLDNANGMLGSDLAARLGIQQRLTDNRLGVSKAQADAKAAQKSGISSFLEGSGNTLNIGAKIMGMG